MVRYTTPRILSRPLSAFLQGFHHALTKLRPYAGGGGRFMGRDLYEMMDWH